LFPEGKYDTKDIGIKPVAKIKFQKTDLNQHPLWNHIFERRMSRKIYTDYVIENDEHEKIITDLILFSTCRFTNKPELVNQFKKIFANSMKIEFNKLATNEETRRMFRFSEAEAEQKRDGLTFEANGINGFSKTLAEAFTKNTQESWNSKNTKDKGLANFNKGLESAKAFVFFVTENNTYEDQINVGRDFYKYCLSLQKHGFYMHPLNQAIQEYKEMDKERLELDVMYGIKNEQKIQLIARIGKSEIPFESYRNHVPNFLIK
jgi:hypothetical protein